MPKTQAKTLKTQKNPINNNSNTPTEYGFSKKPRQQIYQENYQKNKERKKQQRRERYQQDKENIKAIQKQKYQQKKEKAKLFTQQQSSKYYEAEAIKILITFKEYTELNSAKKKLWLDFNWTLKDCRESFLKGFGNVVAVMKLAQVADNLIKDYWTTAKSEKEWKIKSWNVLSEEEQKRLIRYWSYEKARVENGYIDEEKRLQRQSQEYLKEIERAKFHEERGKIKCPCGWCEQKEVIRKEVKTKIKKELENYDRKSGIKDKEKCPECNRWVKGLDEESGVCKKCFSYYE